MPYGSAKYDRCDVCQGDGTSCLDCRGTPFGTFRYDRCNVCGGNGSACGNEYDCQNVLRGTARYDVCDICDGDGNVLICVCVWLNKNNN